jgi:hypothetical protein
MLVAQDRHTQSRSPFPIRSGSPVRRMRRTAGARSHRASRCSLARSALLFIAPSPPEQLRQPCDVERDPSRLVVREHLCLSGISLGLPTVEICERPTGGVPDHIAARYRVDAPGRRKAAWWFCHRLPIDRVKLDATCAKRIFNDLRHLVPVRFGPLVRWKSPSAVSHSPCRRTGSHWRASRRGSGAKAPRREAAPAQVAARADLSGRRTPSS